MTSLHLDDHTVEIYYDPNVRRRQFEQELLNAGVPCPLPRRTAWALANKSTESWYLGVRNARGEACCGFAIEVGASRALPAHHILQVERFGVALTEKGREVGLRDLAQLARTHRRILRVDVGVQSPDANVLASIARLDEYVLEPHPVKAKVAKMISSRVKWLRRAFWSH
jgi:hypothetical protein